MNGRTLTSLFFLFAWSSASLMGQTRTGPIVMGAGYEYPAALHVAPGQLVNLFWVGRSPWNRFCAGSE
jgi:hypothetical protein